MTTDTVAEGWLRRWLTGHTKRSMLLPDLAVLLLTFGSSYVLRLGPDSLEWGLIPAFAISAGFILLATYGIDGLSLRREMASPAYVTDHLVAMSAAFLLTVATNAIFQLGELGIVQSRGAVIAAFCSHTVISISLRILLIGWAKRLDRDSFVLLVGPPDAFSSMGHLLEPISNEIDFRTLIVTDDTVEAACTVMERLDWHCRAIVLLEPENDETIISHLLNAKTDPIPVYSAEDYFSEQLDRVWLGGLGPRWLVNHVFPVRRRTATLNVKRVLDIMVSAVLGGLFVLALPVLAMVIKLNSPGPVFYRQQRIGQGEAPFTIIKLRTMAMGADALGHSTRPDDPRITGVGRWLRATRLDEFPQFWNVLRGEMSVVGPRAESADLVAHYALSIPHYHFRHLVRPGVTGLAQVNYPYGGTVEDAVRKLEYDLHYIRHLSVLVDLRIMLRTVHVVLRGRGR
jgi:exopolysaccharide biosynthesis polyprenyl glycosylphosphotransferase